MLRFKTLAVISVGFILLPASLALAQDGTTTDGGLFGYPHFVVGPARYDPDNFWTLELGPGGEITIVDQDKSIWSSTCARTFAYEGDPAEVPAADETGTCVSGIE